VSQISPPIRILLLCAVAFLAAYMLFLRPKSESVPAAPPPAPNVQTGEPAVSQPGKIAEAAQQAVDATNRHLRAQESVDGADATASTAGTTAGTAKAAKGGGAASIPADLKGVPAPVAKAIRAQKALVLLFWNHRSADDRAVRAALRKVDRWNGRVFVHAAPIGQISRYGRIARGVGLEQSPTVAVVDAALRAETVVGYVDTTTIDQMVVDAFRNSTGLFTDAYLREINQLCTKYSGALWAMPDPDNPRQLSTYITTGRSKWRRFERDFAAVEAPKKWRGFKRAAVRDHAAAAGVYAGLDTYLGANPSVGRIVDAVGRYAPRLDEVARRYDRRMDAEHVLSCGSNA
jgi:hypothetical protein